MDDPTVKWDKERYVNDYNILSWLKDFWY
jgi:hypothetical protein